MSSPAGSEPAGPSAGDVDGSDPAAERTRGLVDPARLGAWMDTQGLPGEGEPLSCRFITGGASNEIFEVSRGGHRWALRRPPRQVPPGRNETMMREYRILAALDGTDVPHARAAGACDDPEVLGAAFYLMDFVDGWSPISEPEWPEPFYSDLESRAGLAYELVEAIARLSRVDWRARGLEGLGRPDGFHERQVDRWYAHLERFKFRDIPGLDTAGGWLRGRKPRSYEPGIMHGDYQFANVMFHHGAPARMAAIVDWEMGTVGDPLLDLAWVVMGWPDDTREGAPGGRVGGYVDYTGMPGRDDLLERYAAVSGRDVDEIDYYVILARFKMAIVLEGGYARYVAGGADNPKMEAFGAVVLDMAQAAADLTRTTTL
ncbi:MAG: phosphotransferase family protein [Acidimicrobiaceae bacterium]|nr:phosphotransferase family protein [Acidimicrobiaceae bacterium]